MATLETHRSGCGATDSISFLPTLLGNPRGTKATQYLYLKYPEKRRATGGAHGRVEGVRLNVQQRQRSPRMLFNIKKDIGETTDLAAAHPEIVKRFGEHR
ncbi:MAG: hypothetical protein HS132_19465 [Planctomycetia bacterium]|nr:hypothetical protein [Planctomycetia bacterium]